VLEEPTFKYELWNCKWNNKTTVNTTIMFVIFIVATFFYISNKTWLLTYKLKPQLARTDCLGCIIEWDMCVERSRSAIRKYEKGPVRSCKICGSCHPAVGIVSSSSMDSCDFKRRFCVCCLRLFFVVVIKALHYDMCSVTYSQCIWSRCRHPWNRQRENEVEMFRCNSNLLFWSLCILLSNL